MLKVNRWVATVGVAEFLSRIEAIRLCARFAGGDWGDICEDDARMNDEAVKDGVSRIMGTYQVRGVTVWIICEVIDTQGTRAATMLFPSEY